MMYAALILLSALAADPSPIHHVLRAGAPVWDVTAADLNGDNRKDVIALTNNPASENASKRVEVFLSTPDGAYAKTPLIALELARAAGAALIAELDAAPPNELIVTRGDGADIYAWTGAGYERRGAIEAHTLLPAGLDEPIFLRGFTFDLDADGREEWLLPVLGGFEIRNDSGIAARVNADVVSAMRQGSHASASYRFPAIETFLAQDGTNGLAFLTDRYADFAYGPGWTNHARFRIPTPGDDAWEQSVAMADIDGNGAPDFLVTRTRGTIRMTVATEVYFGTKSLTYPQQPSASFEHQGALTETLLIDTNNDGNKDLVFMSVPLGVGSIVNYFVRGRFSVHGEVHLFNGSGFGEKPDHQTKFSLKAPDGREQVAFTMADFNGDGLPDLAFGQANDSLVIHRGAARDLLESRPWLKLEIPAMGVARKTSLNGNLAEDLVIHHPGIEGRDRIEVVEF